VSQVVRPGLQYPRLWFCMGLGIALVIAVLSLLPAQYVPTVDLWDKVKHTLAYVLLAFWFGSVVVRRSLLPLVLSLSAFGGLIELAQQWMQWGRSGELADLVANALGIGIGVALVMTPLGRGITLLDSGLSRMRA